MKILIRDNDKTAIGVIKDNEEYDALLLSRLEATVMALRVEPNNSIIYGEIQTILDTIRDRNKIPSMEIQHGRLKLDNLQGTFLLRKYKELEEPL